VADKLPIPTDSIITIGGLALTEHNRQPMSVTPNIIGNDKRTLRGEMRRQVIDVKHEFSVSWNGVPHRAAFTVDRKAGGQDMKDFFDANLGEQTMIVDNGESTETYTVFIESFQYTIRKRYDFNLWDCSLDLVEV
jgi:hypothetical protein